MSPTFRLEFMTEVFLWSYIQLLSTACIHSNDAFVRSTTCVVYGWTTEDIIETSLLLGDVCPADTEWYIST